MDPNATLKELLELTHEILEGQDLSDPESYALSLAERVEALDNWLRGGGFLPRRWAPAGRPLQLSPEDVKELMRALFVSLDQGQTLDDDRAVALSTRLDALPQ